jgi:long-chain fatty acid transport protein
MHVPSTIACRLLVTVLVLAPAIAGAQTNERIYEDLDFRFVTPGARAVGMGKTFIGLGDDATAAASNPAGMSNLLEQEFSVEFIGAQIHHVRFSPQPDGDFHTFGDFVVTPSFLSYVIPARRATVSFFRHSVQDYRETFGFVGREVDPGGLAEDGAFGTIVAQSENFGVSGAYVFNRSISVGGSISYATLEVATQARSGAPEIRNGEFIPRNGQNGTDTIDSDAALSGVAGVLYKPRHDVSVGATFHTRTRFSLETRFIGEFLRCCNLNDSRVVVERVPYLIDYVMPSRFGLGTSWRARPELTFLADWSHVRYSERVTDNFLIVDFHDKDMGIVDDTESRRCRQPCTFSMRDVSEWHGGAEYRWYAKDFTMAFRAGLFTDPDHPLQFKSGVNLEEPNNSPREEELRYLADRLLNFRFNSTELKTHIGWTAGWGIAIGNRWQIDAATSAGNDATEAVVSMVIRLAK